MDDKTCLKILLNPVLFNPDVYVHSLGQVLLESANCHECEWIERWMRLFPIDYITSISSASIYKFNNRHNNLKISNISNLQINSKYLETSPIIVYDIVLSLISLLNTDTLPKYHDLLSHQLLSFFLEKYFRIKEKVTPVKLSLIELKAYYNLSQLTEYSSQQSALSNLILYLIVENINLLNEISNFWSRFDSLLQIKYSMLVIIQIIQASPEMISQISVHFTLFFNILLGLITSTLIEDSSNTDRLDTNDTNSNNSSNNNKTSDMHQPDRDHDHDMSDQSMQCSELICDLLTFCINQHPETCQFISLTDTISLLASNHSISILQLTLCIILAYLQQKDSTYKKSTSTSTATAIYTQSSSKTVNRNTTAGMANANATSTGSSSTGTVAAKSRTGSINEDNSNSRRSSKLYSQTNNSNRVRSNASNESQTTAALTSTGSGSLKVTGKDAQTVTVSAPSSSTVPVKGATKQSSPRQTLLTLSSSGKVRGIVDSLMHRKHRIRLTAWDILQLCQSLSKTSPPPMATKSRNPASSSASHFWSIALIEQGLVPLLEIVVIGIPIKVTSSNNASSDKSKNGSLPTTNGETSKLFPESKIRALAGELLSDLIDQLTSNKLLRQKCITALTQSGNSKLRVNVLTGLLYLCGRSKELGRWLWYGNDSKDSIANPLSDGGQTFLQVVTLCASESVSSQLKHIIGIIRHFVSHALIIYNSRVQEKEQQQQQQRVVNPRLSGDKLKGSLKERLTGGPTVAVMESFNDSPSLVKMQCPAPAVVSLHSSELSELLQTILQRQGQGQGQGGVPLAPQGVTSADNSPSIDYANDDAYLVSLPRITLGSYNAWQEIFSHMVDDYLIDSAAHRLDANMLCELFELSSLFRLQKLRDKYANLLINKITVDTIPKIFKLSLGIISMTNRDLSRQALGSKDRSPSALSPVNIIPTPSYPITKIQLALCVECLERLEKETELMFPRRNFLRMQELLNSLSRCLGLIILE